MATINGREITIQTLAQLIKDGMLDRFIEAGLVNATSRELGEAQEFIKSEGRSTTFNIANAIGQDLGFVGEAGVGGLERAGRLGSTAALALGGSGAALRAGGLAARAAGANRVGAALSNQGALQTNALINTARAAQSNRIPATIAAGVALGPSAVSSFNSRVGNAVPGPQQAAIDRAIQAQTSQDGAPTTPATTPANDDLSGLPPSVVEALSNFSSGGTSTGLGIGEVDPTQIVPLVFGDQTAEQATQFFHPGSGRVFSREQLFGDPDAQAEREARQRELDERSFDLERRAQEVAEQEQRFRQASELPDLIKAFADPASQLLLEAGRARLGGNQLAIQGEGVSDQLRALFGLAPGEAIPLEGATARRGVREEEGLGSGDAVLQTQTAGDLDLRFIPNQQDFANLSAQDVGVLNALFQLGGINPSDFERQRQRLAAPGSGRPVVGSVRR